MKTKPNTVPGLSVVIPTLNEQGRIQVLLKDLTSRESSVPVEIIVVDGGSTDRTVSEVEKFESVVLLNTPPGRSVQMNRGASAASFSRLFFLHADCIPPKNFEIDLSSALDSGLNFGYFCYRFDKHTSPLLRYNEKGTQRKNLFTGGGDQGLFISAVVFRKERGFNENLQIMEDFDLHSRLKKKYSYGILSTEMVVSSRKYDKNGFWKVQVINLLVFTLFYAGISSALLKKWYKKWLG